jgi:hypothetical protein
MHFTPRERNIYRFHDGNGRREADPWRLMQALADSPDCNLSDDGALASSGTPAAAPAFRRVVSLIQQAFGVQPFHRERWLYFLSRRRGLTDLECLSLLADFSAYLARLRFPHAPSRTPSPPGGPESSDDDPGTGNGSGWSSTASAPTSAAPYPCPSP